MGWPGCPCFWLSKLRCTEGSDEGRPLALVAPAGAVLGRESPRGVPRLPRSTRLRVAGEASPRTPSRLRLLVPTRPSRERLLVVAWRVLELLWELLKVLRLPSAARTPLREGVGVLLRTAERSLREGLLLRIPKVEELLRGLLLTLLRLLPTLLRLLEEELLRLPMEEELLRLGLEEEWLPPPREELLTELPPLREPPPPPRCASAGVMLKDRAAIKRTIAFCIFISVLLSVCRLLFFSAAKVAKKAEGNSPRLAYFSSDALIEVVILQPAACHFFILSAWLSIVGIRMNADTAAGNKEPHHFDIAGLHKDNEVVEDNIDAVLVEVAMVAEREEVELEAFAFHHTAVGDIEDAYLGKVWLAGDGAERGEFRAVELHPVIALWVAVFEGFEYLWGVGLRYFGLATERLEVVLLSVHRIFNILCS